MIPQPKPRVFRQARLNRDGSPKRCKDKCYPRSSPTEVVDGTGAQSITYCRFCRWAMSPLQLMRPTLEIVKQKGPS